jgi:hypothetical protein
VLGAGGDASEPPRGASPVARAAGPVVAPVRSVERVAPARQVEAPVRVLGPKTGRTSVAAASERRAGVSGRERSFRGRVAAVGRGVPAAASPESASHTPAAAARPSAIRAAGSSIATPAASSGGASGVPGPAPPGAVAAILAALSLAAAFLFARLLSAPARWRPVLFVSLIERPG